MVFVRVREHKPDEIAPLLYQEGDVRHDQVDAGQVLAGERHAEIDREPRALAAVAEAVEREIHPDLADAAERREQELARHQAAPRGALNTSPTVIASSVPAGRRSIRRPMRSSVSNLPASSRSGSRTAISPPRPAARP